MFGNSIILSGGRPCCIIIHKNISTLSFNLAQHPPPHLPLRQSPFPGTRATVRSSSQARLGLEQTVVYSGQEGCERQILFVVEKLSVLFYLHCCALHIIHVLGRIIHYPIPNNDLLSFNSCNITLKGKKYFLVH